MIFGMEGIDPARRTRLIQLLDIDLYQRLNTMSDGQRRRVQICMGLLKPYEVRRIPVAGTAGWNTLGPLLNLQACPSLAQDSAVYLAGLPPSLFPPTAYPTGLPLPRSQVLLLDEITVDLDVVARMRLLDFFRVECEERGATILYATHIFDGLENWVTHLAYMENGVLLKGEFHWGVEP